MNLGLVEDMLKHLSASELLVSSNEAGVGLYIESNSSNSLDNTSLLMSVNGISSCNGGG